MLGYKRIKQASIALLAAACLVLSGCGRDGGSVSLVEAGPAQEQGGGSYVPQTLALEAEIGTIFAAAPAEDGLYVFGSKLMLLGFDGSVETIPSISSVVKMCAGDGGTAWVLHRLPTDADSAPVYELGRLSGAEYSPTCSPDIGQKEVTVGMCAAGDMVYIALTDYLNSHRIAVYSASSGEKQRDISVSGPIDLASDGETVYAGSAETTGGGALSVFRLESGEEVARFDGGSLLSAADGLLCISDGTSVFEYDIASGQLTRLFGFVSCGLSGRQVTVWPDGEGDYVAVGREAAALLRYDENARPKTQLVLAVNGQSSFISSSILEFNASGGEYELAVKDYSGYSDPLTVLNTELIAGNGPDIIDVNSFSSTILNPDAMVDLLPLIEADPELGPGSLIDGLHIRPAADGLPIGDPGNPHRPGGEAQNGLGRNVAEGTVTDHIAHHDGLSGAVRGNAAVVAVPEDHGPLGVVHQKGPLVPPGGLQPVHLLPGHPDLGDRPLGAAPDLHGRVAEELLLLLDGEAAVLVDPDLDLCQIGHRERTALAPLAAGDVEILRQPLLPLDYRHRIGPDPPDHRVSPAVAAVVAAVGVHQPEEVPLRPEKPGLHKVRLPYQGH